MERKWVAGQVACALVTAPTIVVIALSLLTLSAPGGPAGAAVLSHVKIVSGPARIIDGDTIDIRGQHIRLEGIDTPEPGQTCPSRWVGTWKCGTKATNALKQLISGHNVRCQSTGRGKYGRLIGTCFVGDKNINAHMVRHGHAWAFVKYSTSYVRQEHQARQQKIGIWSGRRAQAPWNYRTQRWARAEQTAPDGCAIKGNISGSGNKIYHAPWSPWYDKVIIDKRHGERWFCSERDATAAGWRAAWAP